MLEAREELENPLADCPIACHVIDLEGRIVWVNAAECRLLGLQPEDMIGLSVCGFVAEDQRESSRQAVARKLSGQQALRVFERTYVTPAGARLVLEVHEQYIRDPAGRIAGIRTFLLDITERKRAEEALRRVQEGLEARIQQRTMELELSNDFLRREIEERRVAEEERRNLESQMQHALRLESMGVLAGGIAHDFNNLLAAIMGYASLAGAELPKGTRARDCIEHVLDAARSAGELTQQMLAYSGRGRFVLERLNVTEMIESVVRLLESMISKKAVLRLHLSSELPPIEADAGQVRQVVMNLITNASDALGEESGIIRVSTGLMWAEDGELPPMEPGRTVPAGLYVYLEVADTGCGMDKETVSKIFDPFFTTKFTGRGLGLAAVLGIVRGHHGSIRVSSDPGAGTTFRVMFPAMEDWLAKRPGERRELEDWQGEGTVLVVDDEEPLRVLARMILERTGLTVLTAADGRQAVEMFEQHAGEIHAVLLDLTMPGMDGSEVFRQMTNRRPDVKVVLCSGYNEHDATTKLGGQIPAAFLRKPYVPGELVERMRAVW